MPAVIHRPSSTHLQTSLEANYQTKNHHVLGLTTTTIKKPQATGNNFKKLLRFHPSYNCFILMSCDEDDDEDDEEDEDEEDLSE